MSLNMLRQTKEEMSYKIHTIEEAKALSTEPPARSVGRKWVRYDQSLNRIYMYIQLDKNYEWYLEIHFSCDSGKLEKYCLSYESVYETHSEFKDETTVRKILGAEAANDRYLDEIMIDYVKDHPGFRLEDAIAPCVTHVYHFD